MELPTGLEPVTCRLQGGSSTIELWKHLAAQTGLEPTITASKAVVLPLHHCAIYCMAAVEQ